MLITEPYLDRCIRFPKCISRILPTTSIMAGVSNGLFDLDDYFDRQLKALQPVPFDTSSSNVTVLIKSTPKHYITFSDMGK